MSSKCKKKNKYPTANSRYSVEKNKYGFIDPYANGITPALTDFLGNTNPLIIDNYLVYRNINRIYYFISTNSTSDTFDEVGGVSTNLQVTLKIFLLGLYIHQVEAGKIEHDKTAQLYSNDTINSFIHETIENPPETNFKYNASLQAYVSNSSSIAPLYNATINISTTNYFILLVLYRLENNPALFFGNNSHALEDWVNIDISNYNVNYPTW